MATIKDVAKAAGVSTASVSRVLSGHPATSPQMRERVRAAAAALNFRPNAIARSLRSTGTRTVGLVVSDLMNPFFTELARAVEDTARAAGYSVIVGNADERLDQQDHYIRNLLERQVDGLIVVPTIETSPLLREAAERDLHVVLVDRPVADVELPTVLAAAGPAVRELVDHLVTTGRRRPAVITGPRDAGTARLRLETFRAALAEHGLDLPDSRVLDGEFRSTGGYAAMAQAIDEEPPDAVFVAHGSMGPARPPPARRHHRPAGRRHRSTAPGDLPGGARRARPGPAGQPGARRRVPQHRWLRRDGPGDRRGAAGRRLRRERLDGPGRAPAAQH